jgi:glycosyltransferase involved in cell wall biosynthesis
MIISIIIPCFNSGKFLLESIYSCENSSYRNFEIIVIDDGSTDSESLEILDQIIVNHQAKVIRKLNGGPASARNLGVTYSQGSFLFFLDSDNKICPDYLEKALNVIQKNPLVGVVYSKPQFFGDSVISENRFEVHDFFLDSLLAGNYIDMCSLVRREVIKQVGGFDEHKDLIGWEDWDFWIRISQTNWKFHFIDQELFEYRVRNDSLMGTSDQIKKEKMLHYLGMKHGYLIHNKYRKYSRLIQKIEERPFIFFLKIIFYKYILRKKYLTK